jgi:hypothetical protein
VSHLTDVRPSRWQRRLAARKGFNPADLGRVVQPRRTGRAGPPGTPVDPDANGPVPRTAGEWEHYLQGLDTPDKFVGAFNDGSFGKALRAMSARRPRNVPTCSPTCAPWPKRP